MLPGVPGGKAGMKEMAGAVDEGELARAEAIILSMTPPGAAGTRYHLRVPPPADRQRIRDHHRRRQHAPEGFRGREEDDADDDGRQAHTGHGEDAPAKLPSETKEGRGQAWRRGSGCGGWASNKRPFYRVVVADQRSPRDGRFIENIGKYHPLERPLADRDRRGARAALAAGGRPALRPGPQPDEEGRDLGEVRRRSVPPRRPGAACVPRQPDEAKLSKKAAAKAAARPRKRQRRLPQSPSARRRGRAGRCRARARAEPWRRAGRGCAAEARRGRRGRSRRTPPRPRPPRRRNGEGARRVPRAASWSTTPIRSTSPNRSTTVDTLSACTSPPMTWARSSAGVAEPPRRSARSCGRPPRARGIGATVDIDD